MLSRQEKKLKEFITTKVIIIWNIKGLKKKKIKTMKNKMAINTCLSTIQSKKQTKKQEKET